MVIPVDSNSVQSLRGSIEAGGAALITAALAAQPRWEEALLPPEGEEVNPNATGEAWTPRQSLTHALFADVQLSGFPLEFVRRQREGEGTEKREIRAALQPPAETVEAAAEALAAPERAAELVTPYWARWDALLEGLSEDELEQPGSSCTRVSTITWGTWGSKWPTPCAAR